MGTEDVDQEAGFGAVERIVQSGALGNARRLPTLLRYVVTEDLEGRGERLKAYTIATDVFERGADFDPQGDSIVRVEMGRLRKALDVYYAGVGASDPVRIDIPKGTYRPNLSRRNADVTLDAGNPTTSSDSANTLSSRQLLAGAVAVVALIVSVWAFSGPFKTPRSLPETVTRDFNGPRVALQNFLAIGESVDARTLALGLSSELVTELAQYSWLSVHQTPTETLFGMPGDVSEAALRPDFIVVGETQVNDKDLNVRVRLLSTPDLKIEWSAEYSRNRETVEIIDAQREIARKIVEIVGEANGLVPDLIRADQARLSEVDYLAFECLLGTYEYWKTFSPDIHQQQIRCLTETVERSPDFADAWAALAFMLMEAATQGYDAGAVTEPWTAAKAALDRALEIAPMNDRALGAAMSYSIINPEPDLAAFREYGIRYVSMRPNNPEALASFGMRLGINVGQWDEARVLMDKALALSDRPPDWFWFGPAYHQLLSDAPEGAWEFASQIDIPGSKSAHILRAIAAERADRVLDLSAHIDALAGLEVTTAEEAVKFLNGRQYEPALLNVLSLGIRRAFARFADG
jgi:adenylate cyclase